MFHGNDEHYFTCGESALRVVSAALDLAEMEMPRRILDFGAGAGRVTRWFKARFPKSEIHACDIREQDIGFLRATLGVDAWVVPPEPTKLVLTSQYDLIWVGSVITHLPVASTQQLIEKLLLACNPNALIVLSFHGRYAINRHENTQFKYLHGTGWRKIKLGYLLTGYGYANYQGQSGYGISVITPQRMMRVVRALPIKSRLILLSERAWDGHHDVIAIQKTE